MSTMTGSYTNLKSEKNLPFFAITCDISLLIISMHYTFIQSPTSLSPPSLSLEDIHIRLIHDSAPFFFLQSITVILEVVLISTIVCHIILMRCFASLGKNCEPVKIFFFWDHHQLCIFFLVLLHETIAQDHHARGKMDSWQESERKKIRTTLTYKK